MDNLFLFIIFGIVGALCIFNLTVGKRNRQKVTQHNSDVFGALKDRAVETLGQSKYDKATKVPYMGDNANGFILCFSKDADIMALITYDDTYVMKYNSKKSCEVIVDGDKTHFNSLVVSIAAPELEHDVRLALATSRHRRRSFVGKAILQDAEELRGFITGDGEKKGE